MISPTLTAAGTAPRRRRASPITTTANPGLSFTDVQVEVDATKNGGPDDNDFGLICRYQDTENFYAFLISSDGFYSIMKYSGGSSETLGPDAMLSTDTVLQGDNTNHLRADCIGD